MPLKDFSADNFAWPPRFVSETKKQLKESMHTVLLKFSVFSHSLFPNHLQSFRLLKFLTFCYDSIPSLLFREKR